MDRNVSVCELPDAVLAVAFGLAGDAAAAALRATCRRFRAVSHGVPFARLVLPRSREAADGLCAALAAGRVAGAAELRARADAPRREAVLARARAAGLRFRSVRIEAPDCVGAADLAAAMGPDATAAVESLSIELLGGGGGGRIAPGREGELAGRLAAAFPGVRALRIGVDFPHDRSLADPRVLLLAFRRIEALSVADPYGGAAHPTAIARVASLRGLRRLRIGSVGLPELAEILRGAAGGTMEEVRYAARLHLLATPDVAALLEAVAACRPLRRLEVDAACFYPFEADWVGPDALDPRVGCRRAEVLCLPRLELAAPPDDPPEGRVAGLEAWLRALDPARAAGLILRRECSHALAARLVRASSRFLREYVRDATPEGGPGAWGDIAALGAVPRAVRVELGLFPLDASRFPDDLERLMRWVEGAARGAGATFSIAIFSASARAHAIARGTSIEGVEFVPCA